MNTIGIIAEYNPFHNGHKYQIETIKKVTGAEHIVIVMSGNFVQRGAPAFTDKYLRTQMALSCGADFVFELPVSFSCASAEYFATAGVSLLSALGFVDGLCFGAECGNLSLLQSIAEKLADPSETMEKNLHTFVAAGLSYPKAREQALRLSYPEVLKNSSFSISEAQNEPEQIHENIANLFSEPNNILAIEYLKALTALHSPLKPLLLKRTDSGYHKTALSDDTVFASSSAIRSLFYTTQKKEALQQTIKYLPEPVHTLFTQHPYRYPVCMDDFSDLLYYRLLNLTSEDLSVFDMNEELYHRIQNSFRNYDSFSGFIKTLKTKQYTYSRISRVLLHLLLDLTPPVSMQVPYARLLGFKKEKSHLLRRIKEIPVITKPADGLKKLSKNNDAYALYEKDISAANLYNRIQYKLQNHRTDDETNIIIKGNHPKNEYLVGPVMI